MKKIFSRQIHIHRNASSTLYSITIRSMCNGARVTLGENVNIPQTLRDTEMFLSSNPIDILKSIKNNWIFI